MPPLLKFFLYLIAFTVLIFAPLLFAIVFVSYLLVWSFKNTSPAARSLPPKF